MEIKNNRPVKVVLLTLLLGASSAFGQDSGRRRLDDRGLHALRTIGAVTADNSHPAMEIKFRAMRFGRPPLVYLSFDVILRNDANGPRWFLLPSNLGSGHGAIGEKGGVDTLEVFTPRGKGHIVVGRFLGTGGFNALLLPARAELRLRLFPISYWGDPPASLQIETVIAKNLTIGVDKAESWFGKSPLTSVKADITEDAENPMRVRTARRTKDNKEVAPVIEEDRRLTVDVSIEKKNE